MVNKKISPARNITGSIRLPGDKSISHRYAMLAALAAGTSSFENFSTGADCASTVECMRQLGAGVNWQGGGKLEISGRDGRLVPPSQPLDCGNSGSTMRMLAGIVAAQPFRCELFGDTSLSRRPMARIMEPLARMGATITASPGNRPPLHITGARLKGISYTPPVPSAQVKSSVLFAGVQAEGETAFEESVRTRDHGELALRAFGAELTRQNNRVTLEGGQKLHGIEATVPGDISSAAFVLCAAAIFPESNLVVEGVLLNPTRGVLLDVLSALGARVNVLNLENHHGELVGAVQIRHGNLRGLRISGAQSAALIDELPVLAAIAPYTQEGIEIRDARELRVKESDRIATVARNLRAMGAEVIEYEDGLSVPGRQQALHGAEIETEHDHRIAMAFAIAALRAQGDTLIQNADCAQISFPEFYDALERVTER
jgi:3-phosphoshikimate 1-carboxyvinyltransferase